MTDELTRLLGSAADHLLSMRRLNALLPLLPAALTLLLTLTGCGQPPVSAPAPPRPVKTLTAPAATRAASLSLTGEVRAHDEVALSFRLTGSVLTRRVDIGARVEAGEVLATLDDQTGQNQLSSARSEVESARAAAQLAALNLRRLRALMPSGAIARVQLDTAQSDWQTARARLESSTAALNTARENLRWATLTAPAGGVITGVSVAAGEGVSAGQTVLTLAQGDGRDAVVDVADPAVIARHAGDPLQVTLLNSPAIAATGRLRDISPQADPQTRTWRVRITLTNPPPGMMPGASVIVTLPAAGAATLALPATALTRVAGQPAVFVLDTRTWRVQRRVVVIDHYSATAVFVSAGIRPGEQIVTAGVRTLRDNERVAGEAGNDE